MTLRKPLRKLNYIPEILYEAPEYKGQKTNPIPYVVIPKDKDMPVGLFLLEYRETGEFEVGPKGKAMPIEEGPFPHMYVEFDYLIECMTSLFPDLDIKTATKEIRVALGLKPTKEESKEAGEKILQKVEAKEEELRRQAELDQRARIEERKKAQETN